MAAPNQQRRFNRSQSPNLSRPAANARSHSMHRQQPQHTVKTLDRTLSPDGHKQGGDAHISDIHKQQKHEAGLLQTFAADRSRGSKPALGYALALNHKQSNSYARMHVPEQAVETQLGIEEDHKLEIPVNRHVTMQHQQARCPSRSAQPLCTSSASFTNTCGPYMHVCKLQQHPLHLLGRPAGLPCICCPVCCWSVHCKSCCFKWSIVYNEISCDGWVKGMW